MLFHSKKKIENIRQNLIEERSRGRENNHPIWGIAEIPDPTVKDVQWFQKLSKKPSRLPKALKNAAGNGHIWRIAKLRIVQEKDAGIFPLFTENFSDLDGIQPIIDAAEALSTQGGDPGDMIAITKGALPGRKTINPINITDLKTKQKI